jgi:hypothetical protein
MVTRDRKCGVLIIYGVEGDKIKKTIATLKIKVNTLPHQYTNWRCATL